MSGDMACHSCDLLVNVTALQHGETASCPRCGAFLTRFREDAFSRVLALSLAGIILLILANSYSFLSFSANGLENVMTLRETPGALWDNGMEIVALIVAAFIIVIPAIVLILLLALCIMMGRSSYQPGLVLVAKGVFSIQQWTMVEVFIIGVIVSMVKIAAMATIELGVSFWAYAAFSICFVMAVAGLDRYQCWERIEALNALKTSQAVPQP